MAPVYKNIFFRDKDWHSDDLGFEKPRHSENILVEMCYLYRRTRLPACRKPDVLRPGTVGMRGYMVI